MNSSEGTAASIPSDPDVADIIAGSLQISRGYAYELMREAVYTVNAEDETDTANARLIAAAPELYALLVEALPCVEFEAKFVQKLRPLAERIRAALAKAGGKDG